jgi:small neutral amino acid transporter SnatA (MarC family)
LLAPLVLGNWHVSAGDSITAGIILFSQALRIVMQMPVAASTSADRETSPSPPSPAIAVFPLAMPAIVTAPVIAAIAVVISFNKHDPASQTIVIALQLGEMVLNLLTLWNTETFLKHGAAGVLLVVGGCWRCCRPRRPCLSMLCVFSRFETGLLPRAEVSYDKS